MKKERQERILSLIKNNKIETQEELADRLKALGFKVTQATVSRDIRELNLTKVTADNGKQLYVVLQQATQSVSDKLSRVIGEAVISAECAGNLLVIKTLSGMGMAVAVNIDEMQNSDILGTIAGDDVVFCAVKTEEIGKRIRNDYLSLIR